VFISYSHQDAAFAQELAQRLEADGVSVWIDYKDTTWGKPFPLSIEEGLDNTRFIICLMSPNWITSAWSSIERYSAMVEDPNGFIGKLLPILLSPDTQIPRFMKPLVYLDCTAPGALDQEYPRIRDHIQLAGGGGSPKVAPADWRQPPAAAQLHFRSWSSRRWKVDVARMLMSGEHRMAVDKRSDYLSRRWLMISRGDTTGPDASRSSK
jgi:hypothetical protein